MNLPALRKWSLLLLHKWNFWWLYFTDNQFCFILFPIHLLQAINIKYRNGTKHHVLLVCSFSLHCSVPVTALIFPLLTPEAIAPPWFHRSTLHGRNLSNVFSKPKQLVLCWPFEELMSLSGVCFWIVVIDFFQVVLKLVWLLMMGMNYKWVQFIRRGLTD